MTDKERKSCICTIKMLRNLVFNVHEVMDVIDYENCEKMISLLERFEPSAQPDIIACGDCKHWICHDRRCGYWNHGVKPLDWCCHAERRSDG